MTAIFVRNDKLEDGHYTVLKELGVGGMGVVYHCRDEFLQRDVAIKMLLPELMADMKNVEVFTEEARLAAKMDHPNIVTVYDIGVEERQSKKHHFVAMEYLPGGNLAVRTQSGALPVEHALNWMKQLANGLYFAHRKGVVHQDVKADNIFITTEGDLKIGDFGLARLMANKVYINPSTKGMGTPAYMSPELCRGEQQDHRSDMYSLGVLFFEMATGQLPFRANGMIEMAMKHTTAPIPSVRRLNPEVPDVLDRLIRRMMEKSPADRYQALSEVLKILDDLIFELRVARMGLTKQRTSQRVNDGSRRTPVPDEVSPAARVVDKQLKDSPPAVQRPPQDGKGTAPPYQRHDSGNLPRQKSGVVTPNGIVQPRADVSQDINTSIRNEARGASTTGTPQARTTDGRAKPPEGTRPAQPQSGQAGPQPGTTAKPAQTGAAGASGAAGSGGTSPAGTSPQSKGTTSGGTQAKPSSGSVSGGGAVKGTAPPGAAYGPTSAGSAQKFDDRQDISQTKIEAAGIKMLEPVGPAREPTQQVHVEPRISAYSIPVAEGMNPLLTERWKFKTNGPIGWNSGPVSPRDDNSVYIASTDGCVYKLDIATGKVIWQYDTKEILLSSPVVKNHDVFVATADGAVIKLDRDDGQVMWQAKTSSGIVSMPALSSNLLMVGTRDGKVCCFDSNVGEKRWETNVNSPVVSSPVAYGAVVFVGGRDGTMTSINMLNGRIEWRSELDGPIVSTPAMSADSLYVGTQQGTFYSIDIESGQSIWEQSSARGIIAGAQILFTSVIFCSQDKWLYCCEKYDGQIKWKAAVKGRVQAPLAVAAQSVVAVSREGWMQGFNADNGNVKWQKNFECRLESQPCILKDGLLIASVEGDLTFYAFGLDKLKQTA